MEAAKKKRIVQQQGLQRTLVQVRPLLEVAEPCLNTLSSLEAYLKQIEKDAASFYEATEDVLLRLNVDEAGQAIADQCYDDKDEIVAFIVKIESKIFWHKANLEKNRTPVITNNNNNNNNDSHSYSGIRYATIMKEVEPPKFDGDATQFSEWRDMFEALVHNNRDYDEIAKLILLKKCFVGKAEKVVEQYPISKKGYNDAWGYINSRYGRPKARVGAFFKKLVGLETIKNESGIQNLLDVTNCVIRGLDSTEEEEVNDTMSRFIAYLTYIKLDEGTRRDWDNHYTNLNAYPKFKDIDKFLQSRAHVAAERVMSKKETDKKSPKESEKKSPKELSNKKSFVATHSGGKKSNCPDCGGEHAVYVCESFRKKDPKERFKLVKSKSLCSICLHSGHPSIECTHTNFKCKCGEPHNYLLHFGPPKIVSEKPESSSKSDGDSKNSSEKSVVEKNSFSCNVESVEKTILLPTAVVKVVCGDIRGKIRVLLDSCSQATLIADSAVKRLGLPIMKSSTLSSITGVGVGSSATTTSSLVQFIVASKKDNFRIEVGADVVPAAAIKYSSNVEISKEITESLRKIPLADPVYLNSNISIDKIDMIIGAEYYGKCILNESLTIDSLDLRLTQFGWIVSGVAPQKTISDKFVGFTRQTCEEQLTKFWEIEEASVVVKQKTLEENQFVRHFKENHSIGEDGKFVIRLPFKMDPDSIDKNRNRALKALNRVENGLNEEQKIAYGEFMREYRELGHMSIANHDPSACFLPHRAVIRPDSSTTPLRTVFNASSGNPSLNDALMIGPNIQRDLFDILTDMRYFPFTFTADVAKMYRMIWVHPDHRKYQSIFWRDLPTQQVEEYLLNTLTYGTGPASAVAMQCLNQVAEEVENSGIVNEDFGLEEMSREDLEELNKLIAEIIRENFYMDDVNAGAKSVKRAIAIRRRLHQALAKRGFILRKYSSNSQDILNSIEPELLASNVSKNLTENIDSVAVLGVEWQPVEDVFSIKVNVSSFNSVVITKRIILSFVSRTFDPLGLVTPVLIWGKLLIQTLWIEGRGWDEEVSEGTAKLFKSYIEELSGLSAVKIPRYIFGDLELEIVGFSDASENAYCAAVYVRARNEENKIFCRLVASKTRVAPIKKLTVPKLELQACKLLVDLITRIADNFKIPQNKIWAFSDSTVALCWLSKPPDEWKTFVSNRVQAVVSAIPFQNWAYVKSSENPADDGTRGLEVGNFIGKSRWFDGPDFLYEENYRSFFPIPNLDTHDTIERRKAKATFCSVVIEDFTTKFSSYLRLIRSIAFVLRLKSRLSLIRRKVESKKERSKKTGEITIIDIPPLLNVEIEESYKSIIRFVQSLSFGAEIDCLKNGRLIKSKSCLMSLNPYLDEDGILRVGGRLNRSTLADQTKNPIILSAKCHFAKLYCRYIHEKYFHAKRKFIAAFISSRFWLIGGNTNLTKFIVRSCVLCTRLRGQFVQQLMGQLPRDRVTIAPPFSHVGVDFAGPFNCKCTEHRVTKYQPIYAAVFVCFIVRAVHIEIVSGLSTDQFLLAFQTFVSRRGLPEVVYSDNATNFVGTKNLFKLDEKVVTDYATSEDFKWSFIPPASPHHGGLWEAAVKSFKHHLFAITRGNTLNFEEYRTLFAKIEGVLNMRPLCYKASIDQGAEIIMPSHFLVGRKLMSIPAIDDEEISLSRRLQLVQSLFKGFWNAWSKDYLNQLQQRNRWKNQCPNIVVGQVVLVKNEATKSVRWPLGIVETVFPGQDGIVRVVEVRVAGKIFKRSVANIVVLPIDKVDSK